MVLHAGGADPRRAEAALQRLCDTYWLPIFLFIRRSGRQGCDAEDLTQTFFMTLIANPDLSRADPGKGKFRSYLLGRLKHFLADSYDRETAAKRGGGKVILSFDSQFAEERFLTQSVDHATPDNLYERGWALTLLDQAMDRLRKEWVDDGKLEQFEALQVYLTGELAEVPYADTAKRLGLSLSAVTAAIRRLRERHYRLIREEVAKTVSVLPEVNEEIRHLMTVLSR